jgi:hypothetical protein
MKAMLSAGEASDKKVVVCIVKTGTGNPKTQGPPMNGVPGGTKSDHGSTRIGNDKVGFIDIIPILKTYHDKAIPGGRIIESKGGKRNPIEEINALRSLCDRTTDAISDAQSKFKTKCERDFMQELCSETNFGQADKTCGEAEALKDSLYNLELEPDIRKNLPGETKDKHGIYADWIQLRRYNPLVPVSVDGASLPLFQDIRDVEYNIKNDNGIVDIIYPSENPHNGMIIYDTNSTTTDLGVRKVLDPINGSRVKINKRASSVQYQTKDITQDVTSVINDSNQSRIDKGEIPTDIVADVDNKHYPYFDPVTKKMIRGIDGDQSYIELQTLTAEKYHERLRGNINDIQVDEPRKSYSYKIYVDGVKALNKLVKLLKPENGLESLSINMDEGGFNISVNLSNRASADVALKEIFNKVGPQAREHASRKFATLRST